MATSSHRASKVFSQSEKKDEQEHKLKITSCSQQKKDRTCLKKPYENDENFNIDQNIFIHNIKSNDAKKRIHSELSDEFKNHIEHFNQLSALSTNKRQVFGKLQNQPKETISFLQKKTGKKFQFFVYEENENQYPPKLVENMNEPYDDDDDIDTRQSVVNYFVNVCYDDLNEGLRMQQSKNKYNQFSNIFKVRSDPIKDDFVQCDIKKDHSLQEQIKSDSQDDKIQDQLNQQPERQTVDQQDSQQQNLLQSNPLKKSDSKVQKIGSKK